MNSLSIKNSHRLILLSILLLALGLRISGIEFGLPYLYHYDEHFYVATALRLGAGYLNNPPYAPTGFSNMLFGDYSAYYIVGRILGDFVSPRQFEEAYRNDPSFFYLLARLTTVLISLTTVLLMYKLGRTISGTLMGIVSSALLAVCFFYVRDSHFAVPDIAMSTFVFLTIVLLTIGVKNRNRIFLYLASLSAGLAVAIKWTAFPVFISLLLVIAMSITWEKTSTWISKFWKCVIPMFIALLGFAIGSFQILANPFPYIKEAFGQYSAGGSGGFDYWQVDTLSGWLFYLKTLFYGLGLLSLIFGLIGFLRQIFLAIRTRDNISLLLISFPLLYYLAMGSTHHYFARYALPLVPFLIFFSAEAIFAMVNIIETKRMKRSKVILALIVVLVAAEPLANSIKFDILLTRQDTRTLAKQWIEEHIPANAKIAMEWPVYTPPLSTNEETKPNSKQIFNATTMGGTGLSEHSIDWYREQGFEYLISTSFIYGIPLVDKEKSRLRQEFYKSLDQELELIREFTPSHKGVEAPFIFDEIYGPIISLWYRDLPGPSLKLYRIK